MKHRKIIWESCALMLSLWAGWQALIGPKDIRPWPSAGRPNLQRAEYILQGGKVSHHTRMEAGAIPGGKPSMSYAKLPLSFEANQGQTDKRVAFMSHGRGYGLFLSSDKAVLELQRTSVVSSRTFGARSTTDSTIFSGGPTTDHGPRTADVLRLKLLNANPNAAVTGANLLPGKINYFIGNDPKNWRTNVLTYSEVRCRDVYPGIDLVFYGNQGGELEYDFVVAPGADPGVITLAIGAVRKPPPQIVGNGDLVIPTEGGDVRFRRPVVYQDENARAGPYEGGTRNELRGAKITKQPLSGLNRQYREGHFTLDQRNRVHFALGPYDHTQPLVIDPSLVYSTYLGGSSDQAKGIAVDSSGNAYVTGTTFSTDFPTANPYQSTNKAKNGTVFVSKLDPSGSALVYSTYLGGSVSDQGNAIAVDSSGDAYLTGSTCSSDFPTVSPLQGSLKGVCDGFVAELNAAGSGLVYSTFLGGSGAVVSGTSESDASMGIAVDSSGAAYVTGNTVSSDFPTVNPLQASLKAGQNAFVSKLNPAGSALAYSTYLGGSGGETGQGIAVDSSGSAYVIGSTFSTDFPTVSPLQATNYATQYGTAYVAKLDPAGSALVYSTYLGGNVKESGEGIAVDSSGNAYLTGATWSSNFPTVNPLQATNQSKSGAANAFVAKLNAGGSALVYSTYLGGSGRSYNQNEGPALGGDTALGIAIDPYGVAYVAGLTGSNDFPTVNAIQASNQDTNATPNFTAFVACLNTAGSALAYSTYLGGSWQAQANGIAVDSSGNAYVAGTNGDNFPTVNPLQASPGGAFVAMISPPPALTFFPISLNFGDVLGGTTSAEQKVILTPISDNPVSLSSITASGDFALVTTVTSCPYGGGQLAAGATCTIDVTFTPTATGLRTGALTITYTGVESPETVVLSGVGTVPPADVYPLSLNFGSQDVGTLSTPQLVTLTNTGSVALDVSSVAVSSGWTQSNNCLPSISAHSICTISVLFQPTVLGPQTGTLTVTDDASNSPQTVTLSGTGLAPAVTFSAMTLAFPGQPVSTSSAPQTLTLTNTGDGTLTPLIIAVSGDFAQTNTCAGTVAAGASCTINVTFTPTAIGTRGGILTFTDNASNSPQTVSLTGGGQDFTLATPPGYSLSATVPAGQAATYTLTVGGEGGFNQSVALTCGGYPIHATCSVSPNSVAPGANFNVIVTTTATSIIAPRTLPPMRFLGPQALLMLAVLMVSVALAMRGSRQGRARRRTLSLMLAAGLLLALALAGCRGSAPITLYGTPSGTYTVTVTGMVSSGSTTLSHSVKLTLNVS